MNISLLSTMPAPETLPGAAASSPAGGFADAIGSAIGDVETAQAQSQTATSQLLINGTGDVHTVALAAQNAEISLELFQQVRNKFVSAYQEIMKMPM